jgi:ABC-type lipoprotein release transport system permease subunit
VSPTDPLIYAVSVLVMLVMTMVASAMPAARAAATDPINALRMV